jgi:hypothetical protein
MLPEVPEALDVFIRLCRADGDDAPFADAEEARRALELLREDAHEALAPAREPQPEAHGVPEPAAPDILPAPSDATPAPVGAEDPTADALAHLEDRLAGLRDDLARRAGRWAQGEAQVSALLETIGHAHLRALDGERGPATVRRHNARLTLSSLVWPVLAVCALGIGARGVLISLESSPLALAAKCVLAAALFGATAVLGVWLVLRLGLLRVESRCEVAITPDEVICRRPGTADVTDRIAARMLKRVEVLRPASRGHHGGTYRLLTRRGPSYTLTFDGTTDGGQESSQAD